MPPKSGRAHSRQCVQVGAQRHRGDSETLCEGFHIHPSLRFNQFDDLLPSLLDQQPRLLDPSHTIQSISSFKNRKANERRPDVIVQNVRPASMRDSRIRAEPIRPPSI
jgi:hypothetical protein